MLRGVPFEYSFMDEEVGKLYEADITVSRHHQFLYADGY
jgi:uncharacterized protein YqgQ